MAVVFVTNRAGDHDYTPAEKWGALRFVTSGNYPIFKTTRLREEIIEALIHSTPDDYLCISGSAVVASLCTIVWLELHKQVNMLLYDRQNEVYVLRTIERSNLRMEIERAVDSLQP